MVEVLASTSPSAPEDIRRDSLRGRGRAAFRGRGRGRSQGRSAGRAHGYGPGDYVGVDTALDQQHAGAAAGPAPQVPAVNSIAGRVDRGRGPRQHSSRPQSQESASNTGQATGQRQPRQRNAGQSRQRASRELNHRAPTYQPSSREELHGRHAALEEISRSATGAPDCVVCCEPIQVVSVGRCNHRAVCERCSLRLIMLYQDTRCPLCKADLDQVVMTYWTPAQPPDWSSLAATLGQLWHKPKWSKSIYVDDHLLSGAPKGRSLHSHLQQLSAKACTVCDRQAQRPFSSNAALEKHVREQHKQHLCHVCLEAQRAFPLELPVYPTQEALNTHVAEAHSYCKFCSITFFSGEELWTHIHNHHFTCQLCLRHGHHSHFAGPQDLTEHLRESHFLCTEEACQDCFIAFGSLPELQDHHREFHRHRMPRWDSSRARHVALADVFPSLAPSHTRPTGPGERSGAAGGRGRGRGRSQNRPGAVQQHEGARQGNRAAPSRADAPQDILQAEGGMTMIDDDFPAMNGQAAGPLLANGLAAGMQRPQPSDPFPELGAAAAGAASGSDQDMPTRQRQRKQAKPLVKVTVTCPCKRQVSHQVVQEGQEPLPLHCNAVCAQANRQQQLAGAFGVDDPAHHISSFDRNRTPSYSPMLLTHAWSNKAWVQGLEGQLASFTAAKGGKRHSLPAMPRHQREVVHALAEQYGLASSSYKQEPQRYVELFKLPTSSIPNKLLSETVRGMTHDDIIACGRAAHGHPMRLTDLRQDVDVEWFLRQWDGQYNTEWHGNAEVVVRFTTPQALKEALTVLGGGIRGVFRVDRGFASSAPGASTSQGPSAGNSHQPAHSSSSHLSKQAAASQQQDATDQWQTVKGASGKAKGSKRAESGSAPAGGPVARAVPAYASASPLDFQEPWRDDALAPGSGKRDQQQAKRVWPTLPEDDLPEDWEQAEEEQEAASANGAEAQSELPSDAAVDALDSASTTHDAATYRAAEDDKDREAEPAASAIGLGTQSDSDSALVPEAHDLDTGMTAAHGQADAQIEDTQVEGPHAQVEGTQIEGAHAQTEGKGAQSDSGQPVADSSGEQAGKESALANHIHSEPSATTALVAAANQNPGHSETSVPVSASVDGLETVSVTPPETAMWAEADAFQAEQQAASAGSGRAAVADDTQQQASGSSQQHPSNELSEQAASQTGMNAAPHSAQGLSWEVAAAAAPTRHFSATEIPLSSQPDREVTIEV